MSKWLACISQTGDELLEISRKLKRKPDSILIAPNKKVTSDFLSYFKDSKLIQLNRRPTEEEYLLTFSKADIITLHGFLYIIPLEALLFSQGEILNGHPGDIVHYPELRGLDPQERAYQNFPQYGCVIHRVTPVVDEGEIIKSSVFPADSIDSKDNLYYTLKQHSIRLWVEVLKERGI